MATVLMTLTIVPRTLLNTSPCLMNSSSLTSQSPKVPVTPSIPAPRSPTPPRSEPTALNTAVTACLIISRTANKPLKVRFKFSEVVSLSFILSVRFLNASVKAYSCSEVIGGKMSRNASLIGAITLINPLAAFQID